EYFPDLVTIPVRRWAVLVHALAAVAIILTFILHVYAAIWTRGTLRAMTRGTVTGGWAGRHHRKWLRELAGRGESGPAKHAQPIRKEAMSTALKPDPSMIGGVAKVPLARLPDPAALFTTRAERFDFLAGHSPNLAPYLRFLAGICRAQADLAGELPRPGPIPAERIELARSSRMPPLDRNAMRRGLAEALPLLLKRLSGLEMPEPARLALAALQAAEPSDLDWVMGNVLTDTIPEDSVAPHLFAAAALQVL